MNSRGTSGAMVRWAGVAVACVMAAYAGVLLLNSPFLGGLLSGSSAGVPLGDFGSFYASGQAAGRGLDPFDVYPLTMDADLGRGHGAAVNLNAPLSAVVFQVLTPFDPEQARLAWFAISVLAYALTVGLLFAANAAQRGPARLIWPFAMAGFWETVDLGQVYALLGLLTAGAWLLVGRKPIVAAALIGFVAAFKPNFLVWPMLLLVAGQRRVGALALASAGLLALVPVALYGTRVYAQWLDALRLEQVNAQVANASLPGLAARMGAPQWLGLLLSGLLLLAVALRVRTGGDDARSADVTSGIALCASLLCSPIGWVGYTTFLLPIFFGARASIALVVAAALLCVPRLLLQEWADASALARLTLGSAYTVAWLVLLFEARILRCRL